MSYLLGPYILFFRRFPIFSISQDIYATRYPNLYRVINTIFFDIFYGPGKNVMGRENYSKIIFFLPGNIFPHSKRGNYCLFFDPRSNLTKVKKCQKCHFLTFINIWGCSLCLGDMFPCGRGVLLWEREILPVEERFCLWKRSIPLGERHAPLGWLYPPGRALSLWKGSIP